MMTLLPALGNRVLIEGPAGSGKSHAVALGGDPSRAFSPRRSRHRRSDRDRTDLDAWLPRLDLTGDEQRSRGNRCAVGRLDGDGR